VFGIKILKLELKLDVFVCFDLTTNLHKVTKDC